MKSTAYGFGNAAFARARRMAGISIGVVAALLVGACQTPHPPAPTVAATPDYSYRIGPLDTVNVIVWRNPELSMTVAGASGRQDHHAAGRRPAWRSARRRPSSSASIEKALVKYIRDPVVTVVVTSFAGPASEQIRVIGEATKPQILPYRQNMTVLDVMIAVGGLTDFADGNAATILRAADGNKLYSVRLRDLVRRGDISARTSTCAPATS